MEYIITAIFFLASLFILVYSLGQLHLTLHYLKKRKRDRQENAGPVQISTPNNEPLPVVTVQLPVYNELFVVERLIDAVSSFNYPANRLEIQVLDDSTDQTVEIVRDKVNHLREQGVDIHHIRRSDRTGF